MLPEQQQRILGYFIEEARDHLNTIEQGLLNLESTLNDPEMVNEVFRAAHSIKGGAAMLGLNSIQHTSHRLEDCFKVLKEHPVQVDEKLESLFLGVSDTLKALLEHLSGPFGLSEDAANTLMSETEPVFQWLNEHLELLVQQGNIGVTSSATVTEIHSASEDNVSTITELFLRRDIPDLAEDNQRESTQVPLAVAPKEAKATDDWSEFQTQVLQTLREMLQLFKQATTSETRQNLQQSCYQLAQLGERWNLSNWCGLCQAAASAIANPENTYLTLAKIVITEIKQAQELVLQGRETEITISQQLEALLNFAEIELLEITTDLVDEEPTTLAQFSTASGTNLSIINLDTDNTDLLVLQDGIASLHEPTEQLSLDEAKDEVFAANISIQNQNFELEPADITYPFTDKSTDTHGPEVGITELNTLADLFNGETPDLDETWHQEESFDTTAANELGIEFTSSETEDSDLSDFLFLDEDKINTQRPTSTVTTGDLSLLFDDKFLEKENLEQQNQQVSVTSEDFSNNEIINLNLDFSESETLEKVTENSTNLQQSFVEIAQNNDNEVDDLLTLIFDENELLSIDEIAQPETDNILYEELSATQENSFDNLFIQTEKTDWVEEITLSDYIGVKHTLPEPQDLSLDNLFTEPEEYTPLPTSESEIGNLFDTSDDLSNFWNQESTTVEGQELDSLVEQDVARALEESLFAAASDDIFADTQPLTPTNSFELENFDIGFQQQEQLDLNLLSNSGDDLFAEFTSNNSTISPNIVDNDSLQHSRHENSESSVSPQEIRSLRQEPEVLDFIPEFTNQPSETSFQASSQAFAEPEIDLFDAVGQNKNIFEDLGATDSTYIQLGDTDSSVDDLSVRETASDIAIRETSDLASQIQVGVFDAVNENIEEHSQLLFEDISINDATYIQLESTDNVVDDLLFTESSSNIDEISELILEPTNSEVAFVSENNTCELTEITIIESAELSFTNNLLFTETVKSETENQEELLENTAELETVNDFTQTVIQKYEVPALDLSLDELNLKTDENLEVDGFEYEWDIEAIDEPSPVIEGENVIVAVTEELDLASVSTTTESAEVVLLVEDNSVLDEFADLEALLGEEVAPNRNHTAMPELDFAALEALLGEDNNEASATSNNELPVTQPVLTSLHSTAKNAVSSPRIGDEFSDLEKLLAEADQTISHLSRVKPNIGKTQRQTSRRAARFEETMKVPVKQLDDMSNLVGELVVNRNTLEQDHERLRQALDNLLVQVQQLSDVGARMQELYERSLLEASLLAGRKTKDSSFQSQDSNSDRGFSELEMDRFTPFHTLSQQMIERIVRVRESASDIDFVTEETERVARQFRQVTTQLQEGLTRARMVPFAQTIDRLRRGVRDNAIKCGKQVELVIEGGDTLIDKMILDHLIDPLTHMLNNAIAHGIETPDERQIAGKPPVGIITIRAFHQGNQTVISVGDDGAGIDPERVKAKAVKMNMITAAQAKTMSRLEVYDLLFQSGFSIKDQADEIAGRGVGMDVVRSEISEIRGTVNTDSSIGKGTTFTIRLPLTLSICKALCCVSDKARVAFPMDGVEDTLDIPVKNVQQDTNGQSFISWRDTLLPFRPLKELLTFNRHISRGNVYGGNRDDDMVSVVVVRSGNTLIALQIDQVLSEQEIVIKQFEGPAPKPVGVAGATVLGDGRIMPIADVLEIIDIFQGRISTQTSSSWQHKPTVPDTSVVKIDPTVLIVDDSITVRELLSLTFNKAGYRVEQARDGQEAWDKLRSGLPCDIVFCDIEMPRCDGLELLSRIQKDSNLNHLPIAMLTSRGADKHRQMAVQLGASGYFTKPYLEEALLEAAARMLKGEKLVNSSNIA